MTPNYYEFYDVGLTRDGVYKEIFNSDKDVYGGSNAYNGLELTSTEFGPEGRPFKLTVKMAPYAAMIFKYVNRKG
jgi:1,4-alpha-glucan branching enzyme